MSIKVGKGRSEVTISGALGDEIEAELRSILGPVADEMQAQADRIIEEEINPNWPVKSGKTRDAWATSLRVQPGEFTVEVVLRNPHTYTRYIKSTKVGRSEDATRIRSPLQVHVRKPARAAVKELARSLPDVIARAIDAGVMS